MANKMSQNKLEFMSKIKVVYKDYREDPEKTLENWNSLSSASRRSKYRVKEDHIKEAAWILRDFIHTEKRPLGIGGVTINYLDGDFRRHITVDLDIFKNNKFVGILYISNASNLCLITNGRIKNFGPDKLTVKKFFIAVRQCRDYLKEI